jgi:hypothetical protein
MRRRQTGSAGEFAVVKAPRERADLRPVVDGRAPASNDAPALALAEAGRKRSTSRTPRSAGRLDLRRGGCGRGRSLHGADVPAASARAQRRGLPRQGRPFAGQAHVQQHACELRALLGWSVKREHELAANGGRRRHSARDCLGSATQGTSSGTGARPRSRDRGSPDSAAAVVIIGLLARDSSVPLKWGSASLGAHADGWQH